MSQSTLIGMKRSGLDKDEDFSIQKSSRIEQSWGSMNLKVTDGSEEKVIDLMDDVMIIKFNQLFDNGSDEDVVELNKKCLQLKSYVESVSLNNVNLVIKKPYDIKDGDRISIKGNENKIHEFELKVNENDKNRLIVKGFEENLTCPICYNIYDHPVSIFPCFHTFCGSCIAQCYFENPNCPICRQSINSAQANRLLYQLCQTYLTIYKEKQITKDEIQQRNLKKEVVELFIKDCIKSPIISNNPMSPKYTIFFKRNRPIIKSIEFTYQPNDTFKPIFLKLINNNNNNNNNNSIKLMVDEESYKRFMGYESQSIPIIHPYKCCYCLPMLPEYNRYVCQSNEIHSCCTLCNNLFPKQLNKDKSCSLCDKSYCPSCSETVNDVGVNTQFRIWSQFEPENFPETWFWGNSIESQIFKKYLLADNITPKELYKKIVDKIQNKQINLSDCKLTDFNIDTVVCDTCTIDKLFNELAFLYRATLSHSELAPFQEDTILIRKNCWYGRYCKTQWHNPSHQLRLNHICHPSSNYVIRN